ncbi:MAG TPA: mobilization protein, partial [Alistipes obesi]|nr:mobilization protein [Alistipes communis]
LLERRTRELKALSEQVIALSRELYELWSRG